jgi:RNA polymerase sigma-70 factor (ECF subfamily)
MNGGLEMLNSNANSDKGIEIAELKSAGPGLSFPREEEISIPAMEDFREIASIARVITQPEIAPSADESLTKIGEESESGSAVMDDKLSTLIEAAVQRRAQLLWLAERITNNREEAEDVVQEALLNAFKNLPQFRGESKMSTWLGAIVRNTGIEWMRKKRGRINLPLEFDRDGEEVSLLDEFPDKQRNPEQLYERWEMDSILLSAIDELNSLCRHPIQICALEERSHIDAANALGVSVCTIKSRIHRGKRLLKRAIQLRGDEQANRRVRWTRRCTDANMKGAVKSVRSK